MLNLPRHTVGKVNNMFRSMPILRCHILLPNSMAPAWATGTAVADVLRQGAIEEHRFLFHETNLGTQPSWQSCNWGMTVWQEKVSESISVAGAVWVHAWSSEIFVQPTKNISSLGTKLVKYQAKRHEHMIGLLKVWQHCITGWGSPEVMLMNMNMNRTGLREQSSQPILKTQGHCDSQRFKPSNSDSVSGNPHGQIRWPLQ